MRAKEIRDLTDNEAQQKERDIAEELFRLRFRQSTGQLENCLLYTSDAADE